MVKTIIKGLKKTCFAKLALNGATKKKINKVPRDKLGFLEIKIFYDLNKTVSHYNTCLFP